MYDTKKAIEAQREYCKKHKVPMFAPGEYDYDGSCWNCNKNIYRRITVEEASKRLIAGCPYCHRSFCD